MNDQQVLALRGPKASLDPRRAYAAVWEEEPDARGALTPTAVVFLTNRECPFRCVMCDLWVNTLDEPVTAAALATQVRHALAGLPRVSQVKLYSAGSFFDPQAIPPDADEAIAAQMTGYNRVVVEAHPAFLAGAHGERCLRLRDRVTRLEVAIGLETAHAPTLARLNKRMTLESFARAADFLATHDIDLRVFVLLNPPYLHRDEAVEWACRSIDLAAASGASVCSVIPTRGGNGAMETLRDVVERPRLTALERVLEYGLSASATASAFATATADRPADKSVDRSVPGRGLRVFADVWDVERFFDCACSPARAARLRMMNRLQRVTAAVPPCGCDGRL